MQGDGDVAASAPLAVCREQLVTIRSRHTGSSCSSLAFFGGHHALFVYTHSHPKLRLLHPRLHQNGRQQWGLPRQEVCRLHALQPSMSQKQYQFFSERRHAVLLSAKYRTRRSELPQGPASGPRSSRRGVPALVVEVARQVRVAG